MQIAYVDVAKRPFLPTNPRRLVRELHPPMMPSTPSLPPSFISVYVQIASPRRALTSRLVQVMPHAKHFCDPDAKQRLWQCEFADPNGLTVCSPSFRHPIR